MEQQINSHGFWTANKVSDRFKEAHRVAHQLPPANARGYVNCWPAIIRQSWELLSADERHQSAMAPSPRSIERMQEVMRWVQWLDVDDRLLLWEFARGTPRCDIATSFGISRSTAWRRWKSALQLIALHLNDKTG